MSDPEEETRLRTCPDFRGPSVSSTRWRSPRFRTGTDQNFRGTPYEHRPLPLGQGGRPDPEGSSRGAGGRRDTRHSAPLRRSPSLWCRVIGPCSAGQGDQRQDNRFPVPRHRGGGPRDSCLRSLVSTVEVELYGGCRVVETPGSDDRRCTEGPGLRCDGLLSSEF